MSAAAAVPASLPLGVIRHHTVRTVAAENIRDKQIFTSRPTTLPATAALDALAHTVCVLCAFCIVHDTDTHTLWFVCTTLQMICVCVCWCDPLLSFFCLRCSLLFCLLSLCSCPVGHFMQMIVLCSLLLLLLLLLKLHCQGGNLPVQIDRKGKWKSSVLTRHFTVATASAAAEVAAVALSHYLSECPSGEKERIQVESEVELLLLVLGLLFASNWPKCNERSVERVLMCCCWCTVSQPASQSVCPFGN